MISLFIMFSNDRLNQLELTIASLEGMEGYSSCQKTLVVDGRCAHNVPGWSKIEVPRIGGKFCWGNMWAAGVSTARHQKILYLDSDRILPKNYLSLIESRMEENAFLFTSRHFLALKELSKPLCSEFLENPDNVFMDERFLGAMRFEARFQNPVHGPGKNVMSGNTAFTKKTYLRSGGVDKWYCGHGAFADTDFHMRAAQVGCKFIDLQVPELHCHHSKQGESGEDLDDKTLRMAGLDNFIYYCDKWGLPTVLAESLAGRIGIPYPGRYVRKRSQEILGKAPTY